MWCGGSMQGARVLFLLMTVPLTVISEFTLTIIHTNDVHAHYAPFDKYGTECTMDKLEEGKCYGGVARVKTAVDTLRAQYPNTVFCDAGDQFQGTLWFAVHRYNITAHFMNNLGYDVMCTGNHEFDYGEDDITLFSKAVSFPLISANLVHGEVQGAKIIRSTILTVGGEKIGFIGYTTTDTATISTPGRFKFSDEVAAVQKEVGVLQAQNISKIIALGHAGINTDMKIAEQVNGIDVVIGGHSNTFLYNGPPPDRETPEGPYPRVITQPSGRKVPVVQDYTFSKYLGFINVTFDDHGEVLRWSGNPILLNSNYSEDKDVAADLNDWRAPLEDIQKTTIGQTRVLLDHSMCRYAECNLGVITLANALSVQPFGNTIDLIHLKGRHIWEILEFSIKEQTGEGGFLQFAGLRVEYEYNVGSPNRSRVLSVSARCADCLSPTYFPLEMDRSYRIATNNFLIKGGDGYTHFEKYAANITFAGEVDSDILVAYIEANSPVTQGFDMRMIIKNATQPTISTTPTTPMTTPMYGSPLTCTCGSAAVSSSVSGLLLVILVIVSLND